MKLVINVPDYIKEQADNGKGEEFGIPLWLAYEIANGTPLPKGHGDLIDVNRKITVSTYDEQYEEWGEKTLTVLEALNKWSDDGVTAKDIVIRADEESEDDE